MIYIPSYLKGLDHITNSIVFCIICLVFLACILTSSDNTVLNIHSNDLTYHFDQVITIVYFSGLIHLATICVDQRARVGDQTRAKLLRVLCN